MIKGTGVGEPYFLPHGVMVAQQILVLFDMVRVRVRQQSLSMRECGLK